MSSYIIQHCCTTIVREIAGKEETFRCKNAIRVPAGQQESVPVCKWCLEGRAYNLDRTWPAGMPNPDNLWPWLTEREREERQRVAFWKNRFSEFPAYYPKLAARRKEQKP